MSDYLKTPGEMIVNFIEVILKNDLWGAQILNVNFPESNTSVFEFSKLTLRQQDAYDRSYKPSNNFFEYVGDRIIDTSSDNTDVAVLSRGKISVTPCIFDLTNHTLIPSLNN